MHARNKEKVPDSKGRITGRHSPKAPLSCAFTMVFALLGCADTPLSPPPLDLGGPWKFVEVDDPAAALSGYDDSRAPMTELPGRLDRVLAKRSDYAATVWFRKKFTPSAGRESEMMVLSLNRIGTADEAYVNGTCVGKSGAIPPPGSPLAYDYAWHRDRHYAFPASLLRPGEENLIALRVHFHMMDGMSGRPGLWTLDAWNVAHRLGEYFPSANNLYPLLLSLLLLVLLAVLMQGSMEGSIALFSIVFMLAAFGVTLLMLGIPRMDNNIYRYKLFFCLYVLTDYVLLLFIQEFFALRSRLMTVAATIILAAFTVFIALTPSSRELVRTGAPLTALVIALYIAAVLKVFVTALVRDPRRYWYLVVVAAFILVSVANTLHSLATGKLYLVSFSFALRLPALMLGAILVYLLDLKNARKERDSLTRALLKKTKEIQEVKRKIPRDNARPEPRDAVHSLIEHLDGNYAETYDRIALARRFTMNEDYMVQLFKKVTGTNIASYINARRIEAAIQLLSETESRVIDIAFHVGFDNLTYFYRNFKKHTGQSPVEYRRRVRERLFTDDEMMME